MTALGKLLASLSLPLALGVSGVVAGPAPATHAATAPECRRTLPHYPELDPGDRRPAVRTLQCLVNDIGLGPVVVDGYYGPQTKDALTRIVMAREGDAPHPYRVVAYFWCQLFGVQLPDRVLEPGDRGRAVRTLQRALRAFGLRVVIDGDFGPQTERAVKQFQQVGNAMRATGRVDEQTRYFLAGGFYY